MLSWGSRVAYGLLSGIESLTGFSKKIEESLAYRKSWKEHFLEPSAKSSEGKLWIHGASVGELEDLASFFLDEQLLRQCGFNFSRLILSSSSRSAQKRLQRWQKEYKIFYAGPIPPENRKDICDFLEQTKPSVFILSQSDLWPGLYKELSQRIPKKGLWLPHKNSSSKMLRAWVLKKLIGCVGTRNVHAPRFLKDTNQVFIGNARIDRIRERIQKSKSLPQHPLQEYGAHPRADKFSILLGSGWKEDAAVFAEALSQLSVDEQEKFQIVILPHEIHDSLEAASIRAYLPKAQIILKQGILLESFRSFDLVFIGGAFHTGLHNILEALLWGVPTSCGPDLRKQPEAPTLASSEHLKVTQDAQALAQLLRDCLIPSHYERLKEKASEAQTSLEESSGAVSRIVEEVQRLHKS